MTDDLKRNTGGEVDITAMLAVMLDDRAYEQGGDKLLTDSAHIIREQSRALAESRAENERLRKEVTHERWLRDQAESVTEVERDARDAYKARAEQLERALRLLPDDVDMIEHHPYDGARYFCCDKPVSFHVHPSRWPPGSENINGRSHAPDCWYTEMKKVMNEGD